MWIEAKHCLEFLSSTMYDLALKEMQNKTEGLQINAILLSCSSRPGFPNQHLDLQEMNDSVSTRCTGGAMVWMRRMQFLNGSCNLACGA